MSGRGKVEVRDPAVAIAMAAAPPELQPMVARASGFLVNLTLYFFSTRGSTSVSTKSAYRPDMVSYSSPRSLPCASPLPLPIEIAIITGTRFSAIRLSRAVNKVRSGPSAPTMKGASAPGTPQPCAYKARVRC